MSHEALAERPEEYLMSAVCHVALAGTRAAPASKAAAWRRDPDLRFCRTCYDHLAGQVGIAVTDSLTRHGHLEPKGPRDWQLTNSGELFCERLGVDLDTARRTSSRHFARQCLDWSERRPHISGALGAATHLARLVPAHQMRTMVYTSSKATAQQLHAWGSVYRVVPRAELREAAREVARTIASKRPNVIAEVRMRASSWSRSDMVCSRTAGSPKSPRLW